MNIVEHVSFLPVGTSSGYMPRSGIPGSSGSTMCNFLRNCQTDFQSGCTSLQSHQPSRSVPLSPHPRQNLLSPEFLILAILTGVKWNLRVVLICISLMIMDVEHVSRCFSAIQYSSIENCLFSSVPHFLMGLFDFLESSFLSPLYILDISPLSDLGMVNILSQSVGGLFVLFTVSFALQKLCNFMRSHLSLRDLTAQAVIVGGHETLCVPMNKLSSPEEQPVLLTTNPSLQLLVPLFKMWLAESALTSSGGELNTTFYF